MTIDIIIVGVFTQALFMTHTSYFKLLIISQYLHLHNSYSTRQQCTPVCIGFWCTPISYSPTNVSTFSSRHQAVVASRAATTLALTSLRYSEARIAT